MAKKRKAATDDKARIRSIKVANSDWEEWQQYLRDKISENIFRVVIAQ